MPRLAHLSSWLSRYAGPRRPPKDTRPKLEESMLNLDNETNEEIKVLYQ